MLGCCIAPGNSAFRRYCRVVDAETRFPDVFPDLHAAVHPGIMLQESRLAHEATDESWRNRELQRDIGKF